MAKHYYNIEFVSTKALDEDDYEDVAYLLNTWLIQNEARGRAMIEYVDSEG